MKWVRPRQEEPNKMQQLSFWVRPQFKRGAGRAERVFG
jgi:hypothetical protein